MRRLSFFFALALATPCLAADLSTFGITEIQNLTDVQATSVRGLGMSTYVKSVATQSFALSIADKDSGSVINMNSNSQMLSHDGADLSEGASGASQAVGSIAQAGIQFGDASFKLGDFSFDLSGFTSVSQSNMAAGPSGVFNFSGLVAGN